MKRFRRFAVLASLCWLGTLGAQAQTTSAPAKSPASPAAKAPAAKAPAKVTIDAGLLQPAMLKAKAPDEYDVKFVTTAGEFTMHVTRAWAPLGADRFYNLVQHHFYDGVAFFRVLQGFMAQFGMSPYPQVNIAWQNANIKDDPVKQHNRRSFVTYAMAGPNTRTTQVFINYGNNDNLDSMGFAPFGQVTDGMEVVDKFYNGYGEGAPDGHGPNQDLLARQGHFYLEKNFPKLDVIKTASVVPPAPKPAAAQ